MQFFSSDMNGQLDGSSFAEPDGTKHDITLMEGNGRMILSVTLAGSEKIVSLLFTPEQAVAFADAADALVKRIGLRR